MKKIFLFFLSIILFTGCSFPFRTSIAEPVKETEFILNTISTITIYSMDGNKDPQEVLTGCFDLCSDYEKMLSKTIKGSDVDKINTSQGQPVQVHEETAELIETALKYSRLSDGAFDITIAPVAALWQFQGVEAPIPPKAEEINKALEHVGYEKLKISGHTVTLSDPEAAIDLGGIAKGYIADKVAAYLKENGITSATIDLGGNIFALGQHGEDRPFHIGIRKPFDETNSLLGVVNASNRSVVTSGSYERYFYYEDTLYHHILDPKTGFPSDSSLQAVTIISDASVDGDALSTTCFVLGAEKGLRLINSLPEIEALFITDKGELLYSDGLLEKDGFQIY